VAIATGIGLLLSGPVGAAVLGGASYLLNKKETSGEPAGPSTEPEHTTQMHEQVRDYLIQFGQTAAVALQQYQTTARPILQDTIQSEQPTHIHQDHQLQLLQSTLEQLRQQLADL
jgi:hypothetical protein